MSEKENTRPTLVDVVLLLYCFSVLFAGGVFPPLFLSFFSACLVGLLCASVQSSDLLFSPPSLLLSFAKSKNEVVFSPQKFATTLLL